ncbi:MAG: hypothetical protein NC223_08050 [Butyrivibrio sp.]|nr:hypothetical protein [Butyrivibrio sp.]
MKKITAKLFLAFLVVAEVFWGGAARVSADTAPKPSVAIEFENMNEEKYYVTLLSESKSTGPYSVVVNGETEDKSEAWKAFFNYSDSDGFYFLQYYGELEGDGSFVWGYYPPDRFKILLYFPERDLYFVSGEIYMRYAFDSYYRVDGSRLDLNGAADISRIDNMARESYEYGSELLSLAARVIITVALELGIALFFAAFRKKYWIKTILFTNLATQLLLNAGLNAAAYWGGPKEARFAYIAAEIAVIAAECAVYRLMNKRTCKGGGADGVQLENGLLFVYACMANLVSFFAGLGIAKIIPGIF